MTGVVPAFGMASRTLSGRVEAKHFLLMTVYYAMLAAVNGATLAWRGHNRLERVKPLFVPDRRHVFPASLVGTWTTVCSLTGLLPAQAFVRDGRPLGMLMLLGMSGGFWLSVFEARRKPWVAALALVQLAGIACMVRVLKSDWTFDWRTVGDPIILVIVVGSVVGSMEPKYVNAVAKREMRHLRRAWDRSLVEEDKRLVTVRLLFFCASATTVVNAVVFAAWAAVQGIPRIKTADGLLAIVLLLALGAWGNQLWNTANVRGVPSYNAIAFAATIALPFLWDWGYQGIAVTWPQILGCVITVTGVVAVARHERKEELARPPDDEP